MCENVVGRWSLAVGEDLPTVFYEELPTTNDEGPTTGSGGSVA